MLKVKILISKLLDKKINISHLSEYELGIRSVVELGVARWATVHRKNLESTRIPLKLWMYPTYIGCCVNFVVITTSIFIYKCNIIFVFIFNELIHEY
jgi:hypothetical protein